MLDSLFSNIPIISKSLDGLTARQRAITENVANADTPGYKRIQVSYENKLRAAAKGQQQDPDDLPLATSDARHFSLGPSATSLDAVTPDVHKVHDESYRNDKNDVDVEMEMANLAETNIRYNSLATLTRQKFDTLKNVLRELR